MEAARTLQLSPASTDGRDGAVDVRDGAVTIDGLVVEDRTLAEVVERRLEQDIAAEDTVSDALEIGARVLDREAAAAEVDFVKREFDRMSVEVEQSFAEKARAVSEGLEEQLERFLGEEGGAMAKALDAHSEGLAELVAQHFGVDRNTAVQHQLRDSVAKLLQESRQDLLRQFSAEDGHNPLADFKASVRTDLRASRDKHEALVEKLASLEGAVNRLRDAREADAELEAERERGTGKGRTFEQRAFELVDAMAAARGDAARHVGDERSAAGGKAGDIVIELEAAVGEAKGRIALDAKDEKLSRNDAWRVLDASLAERDAGFAILVVASEEKVPARSEPLHEYEGNKMIVMLDKETLDSRPLELAYRYARCRCLMALERQLDVDAPGVRDAAQEALSALRDAQKIRGSLTGATNSVKSAQDALDAMIARVKAALERVEALVATRTD